MWRSSCTPTCRAPGREDRARRRARRPLRFLLAPRAARRWRFPRRPCCRPEGPRMTARAAEVHAATSAAATASARPRRTGRFVRAIAPPLVGVGGFLLLWQLLVTVLDIPQFELPAP